MKTDDCLSHKQWDVVLNVNQRNKQVQKKSSLNRVLSITKNKPVSKNMFNKNTKAKKIPEFNIIYISGHNN